MAAVFSVLALQARAAVVFKTLHSFQLLPNGANPPAGLVQGSDGYFYGTTLSGGTNGGAGTVFKITTNGVLTTLYSFGGNDGSRPAGIIQGGDGNLYGTTDDTIFRISTNGAFTNLYSFPVGSYGSYPQATLRMQGSDGYFYGTTLNGQGTVIKISANGTLTALHSFTGGADGEGPTALVQGDDGNVYGTAFGGAFTNRYGQGGGTLFKITTNGDLTILHSFAGADGASPDSLVKGADGNFYGTTFEGGNTNLALDSAGYGTVFKMTTAGALTTLYSFSASDAWDPQSLVQGQDGFLYGTAFGPSNDTNGGYGTVFKISTNGAFATLYSFTGGNDGANPNAVVQGTDGGFYGTTGVYDNFSTAFGTVFKISTNGAFTSLYSFTGTVDGGNPQAGLVQGSDGFFYGTTKYGGTNGDGAIFQMTPGGALKTLVSFGGGNGTLPEAALVQGRDGDFYGTTYGGSSETGGGGPGSVFKMTPGGGLTTLVWFVGVFPNGIVQGSNGNFYGTTTYGGTNDLGSVFQITATGSLNTLYSFSGGSDGAVPLAGLVQGSDGNFYGTTDNTVFKISTNGLLTTLNSFSDPGSPVFPACALVQASDGNFYGTTQYGGTNGLGSVFQITVTGSLNTLYSFSGYDGSVPQAGLVQGSDGFLYGTTTAGGSGSAGVDGVGTVFKITTNGVLTTLYSFGGNDGAVPEAGLVLGSDGSFYGTTFGGGQGGAGTVFRLTIVPEFQAATIFNEMLNLTWSTETGGTYQLQYTSDLSSSNWINLGPAAIANGAMLNTTDSLTNDPQRFYRLVLSP